MENWIPFKEGDYIVDRACLMISNDRAVLLEKAYVTVSEGPRGIRRMQGICRVQNLHMVELMDEHDQVDLALDFGGEFKYILRDPDLQAGKIFSPGVRSTLQFIPRSPWDQISEQEFESLWKRLKFLSD